jgi:dsRNA-specific ribonuclease
MESNEAYDYILSISKAMAKKCKKDKVSFLDLYSSDNQYVNYILQKSSKILKDILVVTDKKTDFGEKVKIMTVEEWEEKKDKIMNFLKNAIVIINEENKYVEEMSKYFPIIFLPLTSQEFEGWRRVDKEELGITLLVNNNIAKFECFTFKDDFFLEINDLKALDEGDYFQERGEEEEILLDLQEKKGREVIEEKEPHANIENWQIFDNLPQPSFIPPNFESGRWKRDFYNYLRSLVNLCIPTDLEEKEREHIMNIILNKNTINNEWKYCFTHKLIDPNPGKNYEVFERMGDKILEYCLLLYAKNEYANITESMLTNIRKAVLSKTKQGEIARVMEFYKWVDVPEKLRDNIEIGEDMFESFFGAIDAICNKKRLGYSVKLIYTFLQNFYKGYTFISETKIDNPTFLEQLFAQITPNKKITLKPYFILKKPPNMDTRIWNEMLKCGKEVLSKNEIDYDIYDKDPGSIEKGIVKKEGKVDNYEEITWNLTPYGAKVFKGLGINIKPGVLGRGVRPTKNDALHMASDNAVEYLAQKGVDNEWRDSIKEKKKFKNIDNFEEAKIKALDKHPDIVKFDIESKTLKHDKILIFKGETEEGNIYNLFTYIAKTGEKKDNFQEVINEYLAQ